MNKTNRLDTLRLMLRRSSFAKQSDIVRELRAAGFACSQATLSGDLRRLQATRVRTRAGYKYVLPEDKGYERVVQPRTLPDYVQQTGIESVNFAEPLVVLHTRLGYAPGIAADLKAQKLDCVAGIVADADTIFVARTDDADRQEFLEQLSGSIPALKTIML